MGRLNEDLCQHTLCLQRIQEETIDAVALPQSAELPPETFLALAERLQLDDERGLVGTGTGNEVITLNLLAALDGRVGSQDGVDLVDDLLGASHRGGRRHRDSAEECTGVLIRHQTGLRGEHRTSQHNNTDEHGNTDGQRLAHEFLHTFLIFTQHLVVSRVERLVETVDARHLALVAILVLRFEEDGAESRRQRQSVQCRDEDGNGHRHTELTIEGSAGATDERYGDEHRGHHKGDGDDGARDFVHGVDRCSE